MTATAEKMGSLVELEGFRSIPSVAFQSMESRGIDLYYMRENDIEPVLLSGHRQSLTPELLSEVRGRGHETLLVRKQDFPSVSKKLLGLLDQVLADTSIPLEIRFALLQIAYASKIERFFRTLFIKEYIELSQEVGSKISALFKQDEVSVQTLFRYVHHNSLHYTHVTNVTAYAVALAQAMDMASPEDLDRIAMGCMLHEVGKLYVPKELLTHQGRLSARDHQELDRIPQLAYEALCDYQSIDFAQLMMVYQQSERLDGTGYPVRNVDEEIHPWAKLLAVVDSFDASTNEKEFRPALSLKATLLSLTNGAKTHFDPEMILCWITGFQSQ